MISPIKSSNSFNCKRDILKIIPEGSVVSTFLFFDGELDLWLAEADRVVRAHTNKYVIYEFWKCIIFFGIKVASNASTFRSSHLHEFWN